MNDGVDEGFLEAQPDTESPIRLAPPLTRQRFERFPKGTDWATDPEALLTPWHLVEARLDGTEERTLLSDAWVNWLPVYDPGGEHLVYLKTVGSYTEARLLTRSGDDLGRLIPGVTALGYVDWK